MQFDMSRAWRDAMEMIGANREVMLIVAGVFFFLPSLAAALLVPGMQPPVGADEVAIRDFILEFYTANAPIILLMALAQAIGYLALLALLRDERKPTVGEALKAGAIGLLPYIGTQLLLVIALMIVFGVAIGIPTALGINVLAAIVAVAAIPVLIYVMVKLSLVTPVIAIERVMNPLTVLQRSWRLTKGNSLRLFLFYVLLVVAFAVIALVVSMVFGLVLVLLGDGTAYQIANGIISGLIGAVWTMIFAGVLAAVHRQLAGPSTGTLSETFE